MIGAAKDKSSLPGSLTALRVLLCLLITFLLAGTRAEAFFAPPDQAPGQIAAFQPDSTGKTTTAWQYDALDSLIAANSGGNLLNQTYRHATPSTLGEVRALNRLNYDRAAPEIVRMRGTQLFDDAGNAVNGRYNQATNQILLGKGSNLGTLTEELIHAGQRIDYGGRIPANMIQNAEQQAAKQLNRLGFEVVDP
jgi:hypothetical protein